MMLYSQWKTEEKRRESIRRSERERKEGETMGGYA
jgi:hypothetical protein